MSEYPMVSVEDELLVTALGYEQLRSELIALQTVHREAIAEHLREAREDGDRDNPTLFALLQEQARLEARINVLEGQVAVARVVPPAENGAAAIGTCVRVRYRDTREVAEYDLVGPIESDVGNGRVSVGSPVGRALLRRVAGETVRVETPRGPNELEILAVIPADARTAKEAA